MKAEWLELEYQETIDLFKKYNDQFIKDFAEELSFLNSMQNESKKTPVSDHDTSTPSHSIIQKIYRNLAKKIHPDVSEAPTAEVDFKKLSLLHENDDLIGIISLANQYNIGLQNITEDEIEFIKQKMAHKEKQIAHKHSTIAWIWGTSQDDKNKIREIAYGVLNLDKEKFEKWKLEVAGIEPAS